jgi:hypothetical protein
MNYLAGIIALIFIGPTLGPLGFAVLLAVLVFGGYLDGSRDRPVPYSPIDPHDERAIRRLEKAQARGAQFAVERSQQEARLERNRRAKWYRKDITLAHPLIRLGVVLGYFGLFALLGSLHG